MKTNYTENIDNLLALCNTFNNYKEFEQNLIIALSPIKYRPFIIEVYEIANNKSKETSEKAKKFYEENKEALDTINKYTSMYSFINNHYDNEGKPDEKIKYFYNYLDKNKTNLNNIIKVLEKLKKLGFDSITLNEDLDFNQNIYTISKTFEENKKILYVASPTVIPSYTDEITYKSNNSSYLMEFNIRKEICEQSIVLNSLLFDVNLLPKKIDKEHIFNPLEKQKQEQNNITSLIKNSVNLNASIEDLENQLKTTRNMISQLENISSKKELLDILKIMRLEIKILKSIGTNYNNEITKNEKLLTNEILEKEKNQYKKSKKK